MIFYARDEYEIVIAAQHGAHKSDAAVDQDLRFTAQHRRRSQRRSADVNQRKFQIVLAKDPRLLRDPRHRLRHYASGLDADKTVRAANRSRTDQRTYETQEKQLLHHHSFAPLLPTPNDKNRAQPCFFNRLAKAFSVTRYLNAFRPSMKSSGTSLPNSSRTSGKSSTSISSRSSGIFPDTRRTTAFISSQRQQSFRVYRVSLAFILTANSRALWAVLASALLRRSQ
jgi:hypothetical protein